MSFYYYSWWQTCYLALRIRFLAPTGPPRPLPHSQDQQLPGILVTRVHPAITADTLAPAMSAGSSTGSQTINWFNSLQTSSIQSASYSRAPRRTRSLISLASAGYYQVVAQIFCQTNRIYRNI